MNQVAEVIEIKNYQLQIVELASELAHKKAKVKELRGEFKLRTTDEQNEELQTQIKSIKFKIKNHTDNLVIGDPITSKLQTEIDRLKEDIKTLNASLSYALECHFIETGNNQVLTDNGNNAVMDRKYSFSAKQLKLFI